jgi:hypothetical protein
MLIRLFFILALMSFSIIAQDQQKDESEDKTQLEKEMEAVDFDSLKEVLKEDMLVPVVIEKKKVVKKIKKKRVIDNTHKFNYPSREDAWNILTSLWLVKNAATLKWDISKPNYGIESNFRRVLETVGYYEKTVHILLIKNPEITHIGLPMGQNEFMLILSIPFIRSMDLSKLEISLLLLEDIFRIEKGYLVKNMNAKLDWLGGNFKSTGFKKENIDNVLKQMSNAIFNKGFSFQQQFELTKQMDLVLKSHPNLWNAYLQLLKKADELVKSNALFKNYLKLYPSPEMQIKWISPESKR